MRTLIPTRRMQMCAVLALAGMIVLAGPAAAAYTQRNAPQGQAFTEQQEQERENATGEDVDRSDQERTWQGQRDTAATSAARNVPLERQIASQLRSQGYGQAGQIMVLATGNRVILLGNVPDREAKNGAEEIAEQAASGARVDNRLHVVEQPRQVTDAQLQSRVTDKLSGDAAKTVRVQAQNGTVVLQGHLNNWSQAADAIDAAFAAGAQRVNSQLTVGATTAQAGEYYPSYGYTPGTPGQPGTMGSRAQAMAADLRLAQQVAQQLQQQLPPGQNVQTIQPQSIYVMVNQGTVTLYGYVLNTNQKQQAEQIVRSIQGVENINNDLAIFTPQGGMGSQDQYGQTTGQGQWGQGPAGQQPTMADRRLAQTIQEQLQNQFPGSNIRVRASRGTVMLQGTVPDANLKQQVEQFAYSIPGVQDVQNNLTVSGPSGYYPPQGYVPGQSSQQGMSGQTSKQQSYGGTTSGQSGMSSQNQSGRSGSQGFGGHTTGQQTAMSPTDIAIAQQVVQKLQQQLGSGIRTVRVIRPGTIYVTARQGTVVLHGFGVSQNVTQQVTQIARSIPGVRNVQSMLNAGPGAGGFYPSYGYVPGQDQTGQQGQQGFRGQPGSGMGNQSGTTNQNRSRQNTGGAQFSQTAYDNQSGRRGQNTGTSDRFGAGEMGTHALPPMGTSASDVALAQQVAQKLQQQLSGQRVQLIRPDTIYVTANQGTVMLYGFISDPSVKQRAGQVAQSVSGVSNVRNSLSTISGTGDSSALGYIPGQEKQWGNPQSGNDQSDTEEYSVEESDVWDSDADDSDTPYGTY
jgi:osmotically-inducible protein OsmY